MSTLLRDLIDIPTRAGDEDYVLKLSESVGDHAAATIRDYVVTPQLVDAFDSTLGLVGHALTTGNSVGAFLEGSFGSGKSHFMAVLHAILQHHPAARDKAELTDVITRHDGDLAGRRILPLAFHLLAAASLEQRVFDQYIEQIRRLHPEAELPRLHQTDKLLDNADALRAKLGDDVFFAQLGDTGSTGAAAGWGTFNAATAWTPQSYDAARHAPHGDDARARLVDALVSGLLSSFTAGADYVDIDTGLNEISRHAKSLGYDAVVLFLDELILWLAFAVTDPEFFRRESQKLTKFVESGAGRRDIPLISVIARQMDLRRWFADSGATGAQQASLEDAFNYQSGRFTSIRLGDDNMPYVAHQRLLTPKDAAAEAQIAAAFADIDRTAGVWDTLIDNRNTGERHSGSDEESFKLTYPFSPALVSTLRSLASAMQRERTALKVMQQLLVDKRDELTVDDVIPVGDVFDLVVLGNDPLDSATAALFTSAKDVWTNKLHPAILATHNLTSADLGRNDLPSGYVTDVRLGKTLLLSAVAPNVPAFKNITPMRLAALNHGSIVAPIPGAEAQTALSKVKRWAADVPEIQVERGGTEPIIAVQLTNVDYESIVQKASIEDNDGRRRDLVRSIVQDAFGIDPAGEPDMEGAYRVTTVWRGTERATDIVFGNVRDVTSLPEDRFRAAPNTWRFVVDFPFDEPNHSATEDIERYHAINARDLDERTIVWLPHFLSDDRMRDLSRLVILEWLLGGTSDRWRQHADHLREQDRILAKNILDGQRAALRDTITRAIQEAYGTSERGRTNLVDDPGHEFELYSLARGFRPQRPVGASLGDAFGRLVAQAWDNTYPDHPEFALDGGALKTRDLSLVKTYIERAMAVPDRRAPIDVKDVRQLKRLANPAHVGQASDTHYVFGQTYLQPWFQEIEKAIAREGDPDGGVTVRQLRSWLTDLGYGLTTPVMDLIIIAWAALQQRVWHYGATTQPQTPEPGSLPLDMELRTQEMPTGEEWEQAREAAGHLFGISGHPYLTPQAAAAFATDVADAAKERIESARTLLGALQDAYRKAGVDGAETAPRLQTARLTSRVLDDVAPLKGVHLIRALSTVDLCDNPAATGVSLTRAAQVAQALNGFRWDRLGMLLSARKGEGARADSAARVLNDFGRRITAEEKDVAATSALQMLEEDVFAWIQEGVTQTPAGGGDAPAGAQQPVTISGADEAQPKPDLRGNVTASGGEVRRVVDRLLADHPGARFEITWRVIE